MIFKSKIKPLIVTLLFAGVFTVFGQSKNDKFIVVLDAGHGGKDPGNSYHGFVEKEIALKTALKLEKYLKKESDIEVIHTRKTDIFIFYYDLTGKRKPTQGGLFGVSLC